MIRAIIILIILYPIFLVPTRIMYHYLTKDD